VLMLSRTTLHVGAKAQYPGAAQHRRIRRLGCFARVRASSYTYGVYAIHARTYIVLEYALRVACRCDAMQGSVCMRRMRMVMHMVMHACTHRTAALSNIRPRKVD
jgi:hypothetical protein